MTDLRECAPVPIPDDPLKPWRSLCQQHRDVNYRVHWGCPDCLREMRDERRDLLGALRGLLAIPGVREIAEQSVFGSIVYAADAAIAKCEAREVL